MAIEIVAAEGRRAKETTPLIPELVHATGPRSYDYIFGGHGAGRALIDHEIGRVRTKGFTRVHLDVMSDNPAVGLYRAMGFEPMAETVAPIPCRQHGLAMELRMMLRL